MKRQILSLIAALPEGEKLPIGRFARELDTSQAVIIDQVQALIEDGKLDRATLRPPRVQRPIVPGGGRGFDCAPILPTRARDGHA